MEKLVQLALQNFKESGASVNAALYSPNQCPTIFGVPQLKASSVWELDKMATVVEIGCDAIRREFEGLRACRAAEHVDITNSVKCGTWTTFNLMEEGVWNHFNCSQCPETVALLRSLPLPVCESLFGYVYFSVIAPGTEITPHRGVTNCKLRVHLTLAADDSRGECYLTVAGTRVVYKERKCFAFDDSFVHSVVNNTTEERMVLLIDVWHPELSRSAIASIQSVFAAPVPNAEMVQVPHETMPRTDPTCELRNVKMLGPSLVGKTTFIRRFTEGTFLPRSNITIGIDFSLSCVSYKGHHIQMRMWDICGPERFVTASRAYYRGAHGLLLMFDLTNRKSLADLEKFWIPQAHEFAPNLPMVLVGSKSDLTGERTVSVAEARSVASTHGMAYVECSSKTVEGVHDAVQVVLDAIVRQCDPPAPAAAVASPPAAKAQPDYCSLL